MKEQAKEGQWWKWPLMPFAALLGGFLASLALGVFLWFGMKMSGGYTTDGWYYLYIMPVMTAVAFGAVYAKVAYTISPNHQSTATVIMIILLAIILTYLLTVIWFFGSSTIAQKSQSTMWSIGVIGGSVWGWIDEKG